MSRTSPRPPGRHTGQAAIELVALVPAIVVVALMGWQVAVVAHEWMLAGGAARAAARAHEVGAPAQEAARTVLRAGRADRARVGEMVDRFGEPLVTVTLPATRVLPWMPRVPVTGRAGATRAGAR